MQKIQQLMGSLRQSDGTYERFTCEDAGGEPHEVFASTDKSPAMVRREWGLKKMRNVISQMADHLKLYADKTKGEVSCQWKPLVKWFRNQVILLLSCLTLTLTSAASAWAPWCSARSCSMPSRLSRLFTQWRGSSDQPWSLSLTTWNARALFHGKPDLKDEKIIFLRSLLFLGLWSLCRKHMGQT